MVHDKSIRHGNVSSQKDLAASAHRPESLRKEISPWAHRPSNASDQPGTHALGSLKPLVFTLPNKALPQGLSDKDPEEFFINDNL